MNREITKIEQKKITKKKKLRVAAYGRVSMDTDRLRHSLSAQVSHYSQLIQSNPDWEFAGVFTDYGITGTSATKRPGFMEMLAECEKGNIDLILTKSIKRFARNTVDLLETVRNLKEKGIEVQFENEHVSSMSGDGELMMTILASFAQEESRSISENIKWGIRKRFEQGIPNGRKPVFGYEWVGDTLMVIEDEAIIVRRIYSEYLSGKSRMQIGRELTKEGIRTRKGNLYNDSNVKALLRNITYTGNLLFQKEYVVDPITQKEKLNHGELPQYFVENTHEAIIPMEMFERVQEEMERRKNAGAIGNPAIPTSELTGRIRCAHCNRSFQRGTRKLVSGKVKHWRCATRKAGQGNPCQTGDIDDSIIKDMIRDVLNLPEYDPRKVEEIQYIDIVKKEKIIFYLVNGNIVEKPYPIMDKRKAYFTDDVRAKISETRRDKHQYRLKNPATPFTGLLRCEICDASFDSINQKLYTGECIERLACRKKEGCSRNSIKEPVLKELVCDVLQLDEFYETVMDDRIERIYIANQRVRFLFKDGHEEFRTYEKKKLGKAWTAKQRQKFLATMKRRRSETNGGQKGNNDTSNHQ